MRTLYLIKGIRRPWSLFAGAVPLERPQAPPYNSLALADHLDRHGFEAVGHPEPHFDGKRRGYRLALRPRDTDREGHYDHKHLRAVVAQFMRHTPHAVRFDHHRDGASGRWHHYAYIDTPSVDLHPASERN